MHVTPFVGVWIEIWMCLQSNDLERVTPFVGVWIEIYNYTIDALRLFVTPFVGVWIEMIPGIECTGIALGHSLRGSVD